MSSPLLLNIFDVARSLGVDPMRATPKTVSDWLIADYLLKRAGGFNYNPAINATFDLFNGTCTAEQAELKCLTTGSAAGRAQNANAVNAIAKYALENVSPCHRIGYSAVAVGRVKGHTAFVGIKAPFVRLSARGPLVVLPGFRMSHRPVETEIDVACSIALANLARDDYENADFEYLYAGPGLSNEREFRAIRGSERRIFDTDSLDILLDIYVKGLAIAVDAGIELRAPNLHGYRIFDPRQPGLF